MKDLKNTFRKNTWTDLKNTSRDKIIYEKIKLINAIYDNQQSLTSEKCTKSKKSKTSKYNNNFYK